MLHHGYGYYGHPGVHWVGWIVLAAVLVALALGIAYLVTNLYHQRRPVPPAATPGSVGSEALHILEVRFARGEIDADEYQARRQLLEHRT